jgi:DNA polymerase-3 subunit alpha (Gram-positive type)
MFPKAHAAAYVVSALRIGYYKVHHPKAYYAAYFSVRGDEVNAMKVTEGPDMIKKHIKDIRSKGSLTVRDEKEIAHLELVYEMNMRGINFIAPDIFKSEAKNYVIDGEGLLMPFMSVQGMGEAAANSIVEAREETIIHDMEELREKTSVNSTVLEMLRKLGSLKDLPESAQLTLF